MTNSNCCGLLLILPLLQAATIQVSADTWKWQDGLVLDVGFGLDSAQVINADCTEAMTEDRGAVVDAVKSADASADGKDKRLVPSSIQKGFRLS